MAQTSLVIFGASGITEHKLVPALFQLFRSGRLPENCASSASRRPYTDETWRLRQAAQQTRGSNMRRRRGGVRPAPLLRARRRPRPRTTSGCALLARRRRRQPSSTRPRRPTSTSRRRHLARPAWPGMTGAGGASSWRSRLGRDLVGAPAEPGVTPSSGAPDLSHRPLPGQGNRAEHPSSASPTRSRAGVEPPLRGPRADQCGETVDVGRRARYDQSGVLRDMFQNHLLQLLALVAMEPPVSSTGRGAQREAKVLSAIRPIELSQTVRGQYEGYRETEAWRPTRKCHLCRPAALRDAWRWQGVPFYCAPGRCWPRKVARSASPSSARPTCCLTSRPPATCIEPATICISQTKDPPPLRDEAARLVVGDALGEHGLPLPLTFPSERLLDAYERLLLDASMVTPPSSPAPMRSRPPGGSSTR